MKLNICLFTLASVLGSHLVLAQSKPYPNHVFEYNPAPGQFIHELPAYSPGDNSDTMNQKCLDNLYDGRLISLGGYGGYITVGFDHPILNIKGSKDLLICGNASRFGTSAEPGIVLVMADENSNGLPDDTWYELAGSEYSNTSTIHNYEITYYRPDKEDQDVSWTDNQGNTGVIQYMGKYNHKHPHYPQWIESNTLTLKGSRLPNNGTWDDESGMWVMKPWNYGYVDNLYGDEGCSFDIDWAIDNNGNPINLEQIDFIRIYTAVNQQIEAGVGELSTEIADIQDLHPNATRISEYKIEQDKIYYLDSNLYVNSRLPVLIQIRDIQGNIQYQVCHPGKSASYHLTLSSGIYLVQVGNTMSKIIVK